MIGQIAMNTIIPNAVNTMLLNDSSKSTAKSKNKNAGFSNRKRPLRG
jgi:hypothetical protein